MNVNNAMLPGIVFIPVLAVAAGLLIGYLWICRCNEEIGKGIKDLETKRQDLERRVINEEFKWSNATTPDNIQKLLRKHSIVMTMPKDAFTARISRKTDGAYRVGRPAGTDIAIGGNESSHD